MTPRFFFITQFAFLLYCIGLTFSNVFAQRIVINEFMASNTSVLADEDGDFEDWIELYNAGHKPVNLDGYGLTDNLYELFRWRFPSVTLMPGEYLLVWASGKDRTEPNASLHASFSISSAGEHIILTSSQGIILDHVRPMEIPSDISYGRQADGLADWVFYPEPTPGKSNTTDGFGAILPAPVFSHASGFYTEPFQLEITTSTPETQIYYTLDGSLPDPDNLTGSTFFYKNSYPQNPGDAPGDFLASSLLTHRYEEPLAIIDRSPLPDSLTQKASSFFNPPYYFPDEPVYKGTVVRALAVKPGSLQSPVETRVFFVDTYGRERFSLPVINFSTSARHLFDYDEGIYNPGVDFDQWRLQNPSSEVNSGRPANYHRRGLKWEYPAHFAFFEPESSFADFQQDVGFRMHGGWTRAYPQKSLRLYARGSYGHSDLTYPFFPQQHYTRYRRLLLRNSGNDWFRTLFRDALMQRTVENMHLQTQAYRPAIMFLNGEFWGIHNLRERYDKHYLERVFGIDPENIDFLELKENVGDMVQEGDIQQYQEIIDYLTDNDMALEHHFQWVAKRIDLENFTDYQIANIFVANTDWPGNNHIFWRLKTPHYIPDAPHGHDGRFRWLAFDMDFGFGLNPVDPHHNTLAYAMDENAFSKYNPAWATFLLRKLMMNDSFKVQFINRFADLLNTHFEKERINRLIDEMQATLQPEMDRHIQRWKQPSHVDEWSAYIDHVRDFVDQRTYLQLKHIREVFDIASQTTVTLHVSDPAGGYIKINSVDILPLTPGVGAQPYPWSGTYFEGIPVRLEAIASRGFIFSHWEGTDLGESKVVYAYPEQLPNITAHFVSREPAEVLHQWDFTRIPFSWPLENIPSDYSFTLQGSITYTGLGTGYMDAVADGISSGPEHNQKPPTALRVRNPSANKNLILHTPSTGFKNLSITFDHRRTTNGAQFQILSVSTNGGSSWQHVAGPYSVDIEWQQQWYNISDIPGVDNNPELMFRFDFTGSNASGHDGNNRFDHIIINGTPLEPIKHFYSKSEGDIMELSSWGSLPDGSGDSPVSFSDDAAVFHLHNRPQASIDDHWEITGAGSLLEIGDGVLPVLFTVTPTGSLGARVRVNDHATLDLESQSIPEVIFPEFHSAIVYSSSENQQIPSMYYGNLKVVNGNKLFQEYCFVKGDFYIENTNLASLQPSQWVCEGDVHYKGPVTTQHPEQINILLTGNQNQSVSAADASICGNNIYIEKQNGSLMLQTDVYARNNLRLELLGDAVFNDGGHTLRLDDDLRIRTESESNVLLSGTILLTASSGTNLFEGIETPLHDLVIDITGTAQPDFIAIQDMLVVRNDFLIRSSSSRPIMLRDKYFKIGGDFMTDIINPGQLESDNSKIYLAGDKGQMVTHQGYQGSGILNNVVIDNPHGIFPGSNLVVDGFIHWNNGPLFSDEDYLLSLSSSAIVNQHTPTGFTHGLMGISRNVGVPFSVVFAIGKQPHARPVHLRGKAAGSGPVTLLAEYFHEPPPQASLGGFLEEIATIGYYVVTSEQALDMTGAVAGFSYQGSEIHKPDMRVAMLKEGEWVDMGAWFDNHYYGIIFTTQDFQLPAIFTLARGPFGINQIAEENHSSFAFYPNPVQQGKTLQFSTPSDVWLYDMRGQLIIHEKGVRQMVLPPLAPGIYLLGDPAQGFSKLILSP